MGERILDVRWAVHSGAAMAWQYALAVQAATGDIRAARDAEDVHTVREACIDALRCMSYCWLIADGYDGRPAVHELDAHIIRSDDPAAVTLRSERWRAALAADDDGADLIDLVDEIDQRLREALPFEVPVLRTADGFFPVMSTASTVERLRASAGLGPMPWTEWGI